MTRPRQVTAFAPGSVGNVGPGLDILGLAVAGRGDTVTGSGLWPTTYTKVFPGFRLMWVESICDSEPFRSFQNTR